MLVFKGIYLISTSAPHSHESGNQVDIAWFPAFAGMRGSDSLTDRIFNFEIHGF